MECLLEQDATVVFGYPGGTILNVYDALVKYKDRIHHYLTAHEQGAAHAADGYARSTGKVGVAFATSGPGATNLTTGVATAYMDSSPVVFISCNVAGNLIGKDSFQEVDSTGVMLPITKCNFQITDVNKLADTVRKAFAIARSGRPGPVFIDILKNVTAEMAEYEYIPRKKHKEAGALKALFDRNMVDFHIPKVDEEDIDKLIEMIGESEKPMLICGGGVVRARADQEFNKFANLVDAPTAITVMGGGGISGTNPHVTGMIGMHGSQASNIACNECDLLIAVGCRFSDRVALDPELGDAKEVLKMLNERLRQQSHPEWKKFVFSHPTETVYEDGGDTLNPKQLCSTIAKLLPDDTILATDVGQHQMWSIQHFHFDYPGQLITSGGFGTMGFGLGAAIGAKVGNPDKMVILSTGDGSFRMNCNELATVQAYDIPLIIFIFNNGTLGMVRQWQNLIYKKNFSETTLDRAPDFVKLAEAYGLRGYRVNNQKDLAAAIEDAIASKTGCVIDCLLDMDEMVRPMVGGGSHITDFMRI